MSNDSSGGVSHRMAEARQSNPEGGGVSISNIGLIFAGVPAVVALIKVSIVSGGEMDTLWAITSNLDVPAAFLGTIAPLVPVYAVALGAILFSRAIRSARHGKVEPAVFIFAIVGLMVGGNLLSITQLALTVVIFAFILLLSLFLKSRNHGLPKEAPNMAFGALVIIGVAVSALSPDTLWLPVERIQLEGRERPLTAYVLSESSDYITTLKWRSTLVEKHPVTEVQGRTFCESETRESGPFGGVLPQTLTTVPMYSLLVDVERAQAEPCELW